MKIKVFEVGMNNPTITPDTQQKVVDFEGTFEEYKESERLALQITNKDIEVLDVIETEGGSLIVDYIAVQMNRKWIRQSHSPVENHEVTELNIIALHNEKAQKLEKLDEEKRKINEELDAMSDDIISFVKSQSLEEQARIIGEEIMDSNVTYKLYHEIEKQIKEGGFIC